MIKNSPEIVSEPKQTLRLNSKDVPEIKNYKVGQKASAVVSLTLKQIGSTYNDEKKEGIPATWEIDEIKLSKGDKIVEEIEDAENMKDLEKAAKKIK